MRVLVVEDHAPTRDLLTRSLARDGHVVTTAVDLAGARELFDAATCDLVVLDLGLPDGSGLALCRALRADDARVPILILTAHGAVAQRVEALDAGADDFLAKPFALAELRARVRALGRRGPLPRGLAYRVGAVSLDLAARRATVGEREVPLTAREWALVELLASREGAVVTRAEILEAVWGEDSPQASASLDVIAARVRRKLGVAALRTVRGEGYALGGSDEG
jgi:DNA-binding response OmpR family regulator